MGDRNTRESLDNYFHNSFDEDNLKDVVRELSEPDYNQEIEDLMSEHWKESGLDETNLDCDFGSLLNKVHHQININKTQTSPDLKRREDEKKEHTLIISVLSYATRIAAILFLPLLLGTAYFLFHRTEPEKAGLQISYNEVYTPMAARSKLILPDSTIVWLNSGSRLKYPLSFTKETREVYLSGEGFFDVARNKVPFIVKTDKIKITAYGTSFDVMAYSDDNIVKTTLIEGKVKVEKPDKESVNLGPSCQSVFNKETNELATEKVDTKFFISWKEGRLIFKNEPMDKVVKKLERWFNCTIILEDNVLKDYRYTGNIEMERLTEVIDLIKITTPINYSYNKETRVIRIRPE